MNPQVSTLNMALLCDSIGEKFIRGSLEQGGMNDIDPTRIRSMREADEGDFGWLIVVDSYSPDRQIRNVNSTPSLNEVTNWLAGDSERRAIFIYDGSFESFGNDWTERLTPFDYQHLCSAMTVSLPEIISAGQKGITMVPPTTIRIYIDESDENEVTVTYRGSSSLVGPLANELYDRIGLKEHDVSIVVDDEELHRKQLESFQNSGNIGTPPDQIKYFSNYLYKVIFSTSPLKQILEGIEKVSQQYWGKMETTSARLNSGICPVHIHFECKGSRFPTYLDLTRLNDPEHEYLCNYIPVVFCKPSQQRSRRGKTETRRNVTKLQESHALYSCRKKCECENITYEPIIDVEAHVRLIAQRGGSVRHIGSIDELSTLIMDVDDHKPVYLITHGNPRVHTDWDCLVIGPREDGSAENLTIEKFVQMKSGKQISFIYLNGCSTGRTGDIENSNFNLHSSMAGGIIGAQLARECIANRTIVSQVLGKKMSETFYFYGQESVYARSIALLMARRTARQHAEAGDMSWLAPLHLWRSQN